MMNQIRIHPKTILEFSREQASGQALSWIHGTDSGYSYYRCRCSACRAAHAASTRERRARQAKERTQIAVAFRHPALLSAVESILSRPGFSRVEWISQTEAIVR